MGRPAQAYDDKGKLVWQVEFDIYGRIRENLFNNKPFIPFRQLGQYEDKELDGLYYNWFRYYNSETGSYISQDPINLEVNSSNFMLLCMIVIHRLIRLGWKIGTVLICLKLIDIRIIMLSLVLWQIIQH
ncbi:hypothetical protein J3U31_06760 [Gilliamella sp. B3486]|nr:hypothetical protein [Gilliamella sp. B3493]MCX8599307.1 hypothetical protein [Gilliamella sp. B3486]MCX8689583.1 hypothetical protein [Gilliamella sp. B2973]MCX8705296.1 hypothetical protein [Gilliamella sp. B3127]